jgi:hypothetical protein
MTMEEDDDSSFGGASSSKEGAEDSVSYEHVSNSGSSNEAENRYFGRSESRNVRNLKVLVFLLLFLVTLAVCLVVYFVTDKGQQDKFEAE